MLFKMKKHLVIYVFLVFLRFKDCFACFEEDTINDRSVTTSSRFYEECCCEGYPGYSIKDLLWLDPNNKIIGPGIDSNVYTEDQGDCLALHIPSSSKTLSGAYKCTTRFNGVSYYQTHTLDVYDPLYFYNTSANQYLVHNTDSMIYCKAKGASAPLFKWTRGTDGQNEIFNTDKYQIMPDEGVIVKNVTNNDAGIYKCSASVPSTGEEVEFDINVQVLTMPKIKQLTASPENIVTVGELLRLECLAEGLPEPEYIWRKVSDPKSGEAKALWQQKDNIIHFNVTEDDAGTYECLVKNFVGNNSETIDVKVLVPPKILGFADRIAVDGSEILIHCNVTGNPPPNVTITYEGKSFEEEKNTIYDQIIENYSVFKVNRSKAGMYLCNATNEVGFETEIMNLTVQHPPYFDKDDEIVWGWNGELVNLSCVHEAIPPANLTWRYMKGGFAEVNETDLNDQLDKHINIQSKLLNISEDFSPYGLYVCIAKNELGEAKKQIHLKKGYVPLGVQNASIFEVTASSVTFSIDVPVYDDGPEVLGINAEYDIVENYNITHIHRNRTWAIGRPFKLEQLKPNSTYYVRFAAVNRVGTGLWGETMAFSTLDKSPPEPPIWQVDPLQFSASNVLKWKEPEDNGEPIDYYALRYCPLLEEFDESLCKEHRIVAATEQLLSDLQYNTTYYIELIAHNAEGNSSSANISLTVSAAEDAVESAALLSGGAIIGLSVAVVILSIILLDLLLLFWRRQGIIATCCYKKNKKKPNALHSRDKKGLLKDNGESTEDTLRRPNNGHREYEYNKTTGIITGKHSSV